MIWAIPLVALVLLALLVAAVAVTVDNWRRDLVTNVAETSWDAEPAMQPLVTTASPEAIDEAARQWASRSPNWEYLGREEDDRREAEAPAAVVRLVHVTSWLRFRDDVTLTLTRQAGGTTVVQIRSASRVGKGDLGQNPRNIRALRQALAESDSLRGTLQLHRPASRQAAP